MEFNQNKKKYLIGALLVAILIGGSVFVSRYEKRGSGMSFVNQVLNAKVPNFASNEDEMVTLNNGEVEGVYESDGIGHWSLGLDKDFMVSNDYSNDGVPDVASVLIASGGGSGIFYYLVLFANENGSPRYITSQYLGDRIKVNNIVYKDKVFSVDMITQGPDEGYCCGTLHKVFEYKLLNGKLSEIKT